MSELRDERFCAHDSRQVVYLADRVPRCPGCHTEMMWVPKYVLEGYTRIITDQSGIIEDLRSKP